MRVPGKDHVYFAHGHWWLSPENGWRTSYSSVRIMVQRVAHCRRSIGGWPWTR